MAEYTMDPTEQRCSSPTSSAPCISDTNSNNNNNQQQQDCDGDVISSSSVNSEEQNSDCSDIKKVLNGGIKITTTQAEIAEEQPLIIIDEKPVLRVQFNNNNNNNRTPDSISNSSSSSRSDNNSSNSSSSSSSSSDDDDLELSEAHPPDGGWGWVVVFASFIVNLIADGITFSFGVIYVEFLKYFGQNRGTTAWIGSLFMAMPLLSGPIASFLTDRYGCRKVTIFGSILSASGFIISSTANSMTVLCITFGALAGFGLSLCYVASVVIVAYYFDKKRSLATGLAVCGSGIGTFIFAPFIQYLLNEYGWRGTTLILAGFLLNLAVCGALMRDLPWTHEKLKIAAKQRKRSRHLKRKSKGGSSVDTFSVSNSTNTASVLQTINENGGGGGGGIANNIMTNNAADNNDYIVNNDQRLSSSLVNLPTYVKNGEKVPIEVIELLSQHKNVYNLLITNYPSLLTPSKSFSDSCKLNDVKKLDEALIKTPPSSENAAYLWWLKRNEDNIIDDGGGGDEQLPSNKLNNKIIKPQAFLRDLRIHRLSVTYRGAMLNINRYRLRASSCPDIYRNSMTTIAKEMSHQWLSGLWDFWDLIVDMFDFSHFADSKFLLFAISNFLLYTWYDVPYVYLTDNAATLGYSDGDASILISIIGIINMVGEIILGWAGDRPWANASIIYAVCMGLCGGVLALVPLINGYWFLCIISGAFGFFIAANYSLTCIILVELITLDHFTNAYGLLLMVQGIANLIGPPLGGWLFDITDKYDLSFYLAGLFIALSGLLLLILPIMKSYKKYVNNINDDGNNDDDDDDVDNDDNNGIKLFNIITSRIRKTVQKSNVDASHI